MQKYAFTLTILTLFISCALAFSAPDTPETRRHEAERYLQATPPKALFEDMAEKMAANLPPDQREPISEADDFATRHRGINQGDDRLDGEAFHHRGVESTGRFLRFARREICDAKVRRLHGGHHAGDGGRNNESPGKAEPIASESNAEMTLALRTTRSTYSQPI